MLSDVESEEVERTVRAMRARIAKFMLYDSQSGVETSLEVDARTATILRKSGVFREPIPIEIDDDVWASLINIQHPSRVEGLDGPLLFLQKGTTNQRVVSKISGLLFTSSEEKRLVVLDYFRVHLANLQMLSARTVQFLESKKLEMSSTDPQIWGKAAVQIYDAIESDWLCNLAGLKESLTAQFQESYSDYLSQVMRPNLRSIESLVPQIVEATSQRGQISDAIKNIVATSPTLEDALHQFFGLCGHLPLGGDNSASNLVQKWAELRDHEENLWSRVWGWASNESSPLARYHACQIFLSQPEIVPAEESSKLWHEIAEICHIPLIRKSQIGNAGAWRLRLDLARHFTYYLETLIPGMSGETAAVFAWMMSEKVSDIYGADTSVLEMIQNTMSSAEYDTSSRIWQIVSPPTLPSDFRFATLFVNSVWSISLLSQIWQGIDRLKPNEMDSKDRELIEGSIRGNLVLLFPIRATVDLTFGFDATIIPTAEAWCKCLQNTTELAAFIEMFKQLQSEDITKSLEALGDGVEAHDMLIGQLLRVLAYQRRAPVELLWEKLLDEKWRNKMFLKAPDRTVEILVPSFIQFVIGSQDKWPSHLPHFLAKACEEASDQDRRSLLFAFTIQSAIAGGTVSAIRRLVTGDKRKELGTEVTIWRQRLEEALVWATPWAAGRIRDLLCALEM